MGEYLRVIGTILLLVVAWPAQAAPPVNYEPPRTTDPAKISHARDLFTSAARKFDVGNYEGAVTDFRDAYELVGDPVILYNIGKSYQLWQNSERALFFYRQYLRRSPNAPNKAEVQARIDELTQAMLHATRGAVPPVGIIQPGEVRPSEPRQPPPREEPPPPEPAETPHAEPKPPPAAVTPSEPPKPPKQQEPLSPKQQETFRSVGIAMGVVALAGLATGIALTAQASSDATKLHDGALQHKTFDSGLMSAQRNGKLFDNVSIAGYAVAGVAAAASIATLYLGYRRQPGRTALAPQVSANSVGLIVAGQF